MNSEHEFYRQLAKTIQTWLGVESEIYRIYALVMTGAHSQLVSVTFHSIESFDSKIKLIDMCLKLLLSNDSNDWKSWRKLRNKADKLNGKRNIIVHQPVKFAVEDGVGSYEISPSFFNAVALAKGQTTYDGPTISPEYRPSLAKLKDEHKIEFQDLLKLELKFMELSQEFRAYREAINENIVGILDEVTRGKNNSP